MSATNRGSERITADAYYTPISVIENFFDHYELTTTRERETILEPSAGCGNFLKVIRNRYGDSFELVASELREEEKHNLEQIADDVHIGNFLEFKKDKKYKYIIGNPPYTIAKEFMEKCFEIADKDTVIIMLLRTAFLESKKRYEFWQKHPLNGLYVLSQRPSFTGKGTDATSYSIFIWDGGDKQEIKVI